MTYYAFIKDNQIDGTGECPVTNDDIVSFEISEEVYNDIERYIWDGTDVIIDPDYEEHQAELERERLNQLSLTKREVFLALYKDKGITPEQIKTQISSPEALIEFEYATDYYRGNPLINLIGQTLGYTVQELDYLFEHKELPNGSVG